MRAQVYMIPKQLLNLDYSNPKTKVLLESGLLGGIVVNCHSQLALETAINASVGFGHPTDVIYLDEVEPWPTAEERRNDFLARHS